MKINKPCFSFENNTKKWEPVPLGDVLKINSGRDYKHLNMGEVPVYGTGGYMLSVNQSLSKENAIGIGRKGTIDKPQLLYAPFWTVDTLFFMTPQKNNDLYFLYTYMQKINWKSYDESSGVPSLSKLNIEKINMFVPDGKEQIQIGSLFKDLDDLIFLHEQELEAIKQTKQGFLQKMFPKEGDTAPAFRFKEFNEGWIKINFYENIKKIIDFRGRTPKKIGLEWSKEGYLALSALNVKKGYIDYTVDAYYGNEELYRKWMNGNELKAGQVVFTTEAPMGNVAQIPDNAGYILSQRTIAFEVNKDMITDDFLFVLLSSPIVFNNLSALSSGGTAKGVSQKSLSKLSVTIPRSINEQKIIADFFIQLNQMIKLKEQELEALKQTKKGFLQKMFA